MLQKVLTFYAERTILLKYLKWAKYRSEYNFVGLSNNCMKLKHDEQCIAKSFDILATSSSDLYLKVPN